MSLSSLQLDAFLAVAVTRSFSRAARSLRLTQSALSQRVLNLERELGAAVFVRDPGGVRLTETGEELLRYCRARQGLEEEFLGRLREGSGEDGAALSGTVRIGGFSSVMRSIIVPALDPLIRANPGVLVELVTRELRELPGLFTRGEVDFLVTPHEPRRAGIRVHELGAEEYVLVEGKGAMDVYLDHDPEDTTTLEYLRLQGQRMSGIRRSYLDEIYAIIDGVRLGWGRAVLPRHLIPDAAGLHLPDGKGAKALRVPVYLQYPDQPFYPRLHERVVQTIVAGAAKAFRRAGRDS